MDLGPIPGEHRIALGLDLRLGHLKQLVECAPREPRVDLFVCGSSNPIIFQFVQ